jgi:putative zinc finger protein
MTHLELENLASEYLEGLLDQTRRAEVEAHLANCPPCRDVVEEVRRVMQVCQAAQDREPAPWLIEKILLATTGARKPTLREQLVALLRPAFQPRVAYAAAMAVFSFSVIVNVAGINLREVRLTDLNPRTWAFRANRARHNLFARAEKFYYDLRVVYEIESRLRQLRAQPQDQEKEAPKAQPPAGGSSDSEVPGNPQLASVQDSSLYASVPAATPVIGLGRGMQMAGTGRSLQP